jgi:hypothetical protein
VLIPAGRRARPASTAPPRPVPVPRSSTPSRGATLHEASTKVQAIHPSGLPLARHRPDGNEQQLRLSPSFAPRRPEPDNARRGGDRPSSTDLRHALRHLPNLQCCVSTHYVRPRVAPPNACISPWSPESCRCVGDFSGALVPVDAPKRGLGHLRSSVAAPFPDKPGVRSVAIAIARSAACITVEAIVRDRPALRAKRNRRRAVARTPLAGENVVSGAAARGGRGRLPLRGIAFRRCLFYASLASRWTTRQCCPFGGQQSRSRRSRDRWSC